MRNLGVGGLLGGASGVDVVAPCAHVLLLLEVIALVREGGPEVRNFMFRHALAFPSDLAMCVGFKASRLAFVWKCISASRKVQNAPDATQPKDLESMTSAGCMLKPGL